MKTSKAYDMGKAAFLRGIKCAPALDMKFMESLPPAPMGANTRILTAWIAGWTAENLK